jgi:RNA polymerase sigma-70 factor (ECF subfamily)
MQLRRDGGWPASASEALRSVQSAVDLVLRRLIGAKDPEYDDLVQSSLEQVLSTFERGRFRGDCPTGGWAAIIARNVAIDAIRARTLERRLFSRETADARPADAAHGVDWQASPEQLTDSRRRLRRVKNALAGLCPNKSNVVVLHDILGYPLLEVSAILAISVAAAQSRLVRGRRELIDRVGTGAGEIGGRGSSPPRKRAGRRAPPVLS